jgi:putative transcriptional regulator
MKELRAARSMTQAELAEIISVSSRTIISLEKGQYNPSVMLAHKLSLVFGCPIEDVFIFEKEDGI